MRALVFALALTFALLACAGAAGQKPRSKMLSWQEIERLVSEQKLEAAAQGAEARLEAAKRSGDEDEWARALIRVVQLRIGLHGYETSVRFLKTEPWPKGLLPRTALNLYYAGALAQYASAYQWEIQQRERVESREAVDLKAWTMEQIHAEAQRAFEEIWASREALGREPVGRLGEYVTPNNYPPGIRDTLRDAVTYLRVELLADTSTWRPEQSNELYQLELSALVKGDPRGSASVRLEDPAVHPLVRIGALLDDLEQWHLKTGRREAALEARLQRARILHRSFTQAADREVIREDLEARLPAFRAVPWFAAGKAALAELVRDGGDLARARKIAIEGGSVYPATIGGQRCAHLVATIEAPEYQLASMVTDGLGRRSIEVTAKNLPELHFRAYRVDLESWLASSADYSLLPNRHEMARLVSTDRPEHEWTVALPETPDYRTHKTYVTPPLSESGLYVVVASARKDFADEGNRLAGVNLVVSSMAIVMRDDGEGGNEVTVVSGETGAPLAGVEVSLRRMDYHQRRDVVERRRTDARGTVAFSFDSSKERSSFFVVAKKDREVAIQLQAVGFNLPQEQKARSVSLVFTDRSVYRPQQRLLWKVVAYHGDPKDARYRTLAGSAVTVTLHDPNYQVVETRRVKTNAFGSAAGEFTIPTGRLLGTWQVRADPQGQAQVRVEEYKRPTFEVSFKDAESAMRLNQPATLVGEARYYFGQPVAAGTVKWSVKRAPVYPSWWWWRWGAPASTQPQLLEAGSAKLEDDGTFRFTFTPSADERGRELTYRYEVSADVTDEGGETRSAKRVIRLGRVSVEAAISAQTELFSAGTSPELTLARTNLDGAPAAGKGRWRLLALEQPAEAVLPAELPVDAPPEPAERPAVVTPGDRLRPRWNPQYRPLAVVATWRDGAEEASAEVEHGANGEVSVKLPKLAAGAYRLRYETVDDFGAKYETFRDLIVVGPKAPLELPAVLIAERARVGVGETARLLAHSGLPNQTMLLEVHRAGKRVERRVLVSGKDPSLVELPVREADRGGFSVSLTVLRDYQLMHFNASVFVPWDDKELKVELATFRDRIRPGSQETWRVTVRGPQAKKPEAAAAELLAYMYDQSLDVFAPHSPPSILSLYPNRARGAWLRSNLGQSWAQQLGHHPWFELPPYPHLSGDQLKLGGGYAIGGPGSRRMRGEAMMAPGQAAPRPPAPAMSAAEADGEQAVARETSETSRSGGPRPAEDAEVELRSDFSETAFWMPQLLTGSDGSATLEFKVPDSVTAWNVWVHALTKDLRGGSVSKKTRSVKDLMVRPYLPRFFREGDRAGLKVVVNNASGGPLRGELRLEILDPDTEESLLSAFGPALAGPRPFSAEAGKNATLTFPLSVPKRVGPVAFRVTAKAGDFSDGELRALPVLPSRMHLAQSRFVTLRDKDRRTLTFADMAKGDDPTLVHEQLVVTIDAQLFTTVLQALPYLASYPYECTEQTLNRFLSTAIVSSVFRDHPAVAKMAAELAKRETPLETFDSKDPNRKMALEESPWLLLAQGGKHPDSTREWVNVLDPRNAQAERDAALAKLRKAQTESGGFPWWPGGPPSAYMTLYLAHGLAKAAEFKVEVPKDMVQRAWAFLARHYRDEYAGRLLKEECCWEFLTFLNYVASSYPDASYTGGALTLDERRRILDFTFKHWRQHSPFLKGYLALTLQRMGRPDDARLVFDSVMDSAKTTPDEGTFWAPEDRSWLWYNDSIEAHAFALRTLSELSPKDPRRAGLVQWLLLNKKLNHWKSTRATAEVIYSLVKYLQGEGALGVREETTVTLGPTKVTLVFEPEKYTGKGNQIVVPGPEVDPKAMSTVVVEKESKGFQFASATWHFATDELPTEDRGDLFGVSRRYFSREKGGREVVLRPLAEGAKLEPGDEIEVHLSIRARHAAEYVHLRDPRAAGLEPENAVSRYRWDLGIGWYEEIRDSGTNFFFEQLPAGEYTFKYRLRAAMAGTFRIGPATLQSMYAPEFTAYSAGHVLKIE